jgi:ABC-2 type transport system permease protein
MADVAAHQPPAGAFRPDFNRRIAFFHVAGFLTLLRREFRRFQKLAGMMIFAPALMALIYFVCFSMGLGGQRGTPAGDAVLTFIVPGLAMMSVLLRAVEINAFSVLGSKLDGVILDQLMAPVGAMECLLAYALSAMFTGVICGLAVLAATLLIWPVAMQNPAGVLLFACLGALMMGLAGVLVGLVSAKWDHVAAFFTFIFVPLTFISGAFAPVETMPPLLRTLVQCSPIFYAVDGARWAWLGQGHQDPLVSAGILLLTITLLAITGGWIYASGWKLRP